VKKDQPAGQKKTAKKNRKAAIQPDLIPALADHFLSGIPETDF
jgi:hypothetical protein